MVIKIKQQYPTDWRRVWSRAVGLPLMGLLIISLSYSFYIFEPAPKPAHEESFSTTVGQVRQIIWDGSMQLMLPHDPLGIPGNAHAVLDRFNLIRPLIGYGPESLFYAYAFIYPVELTHVEGRGSSVDRNHNETMDILVTTGLLGVITFYSFLSCLLVTAFTNLGLLPHARSGRGLIVCLIGGSIIGMFTMLGLDHEGSPLTLVLPFGLPFGLLSGMTLYLIGQSVTAPALLQTGRQVDVRFVGVLGSLISYLILAHFQFSIASSYLYFWLYAGVLVAAGYDLSKGP